MNLDYSISADRKTLTIKADESARAELREMKADDVGPFGTNQSMWDVFEQLTCNSELKWIAPETCGDLTEAPILGILGMEEELTAEQRKRDLGDWHERLGNGVQWERPVVERWGYMSYQVRSVLDDLLDKGEAIFTAP